jgi:hypothetical protein
MSQYIEPGERLVTEPWSSRWYVPLVVIGMALLALMVAALALVEVLVAEAPVLTPGAWATQLERSDEALRDGDVAEALSWWREARVAALRSRQWESMIEVGDASRRLGARGNFRRDGDALARDAYMTALIRARRQQSFEGLLRAAVAFGELGDGAVVGHAVRIAERQAGQDPRARAQVRAVADRWMMPSLDAEHRTDTLGGR